MEKIFDIIINFIDDYYVGLLSIILVLAISLFIAFINIKKIERKRNEITEFKQKETTGSWYISDDEHEAYSQVNEKVLFNSPLTFSLADIDINESTSIKLNPYYLEAINDGVLIIEKTEFKIVKI